MAGILDYTSQNPWVGDTLQTIAQGLLAYGTNNPQLMTQIPLLQQRRQEFRADQKRQSVLDNREQQLFEMKMRDLEDRKRKEQQAQQAFTGLLGGQAPANGMSQAQFGGAPQTQGLLGGQFTPEQTDYLKAVGSIDPMAGLGAVGERLMREPEKVTPTSGIAKIQYDLQRGLLTPEQAEAAIRKETYIAPQQPPQGPADIQEYNFAVSQGFPGTFMDFKAAQKGQGMSVTLPDGTVMQVGGTSKPVTAADQATSLRATMLDDAVKEFEGINFDNIRTPMIVAAEKSKDSPIAGAFVQTNLNEDEKKLLGNQGKIQEAVISAITGAAYTEEQKQNMRAAYVPLATDDFEERTRKLKDAAKFLKQMNRGVNRQNQYMDGAEVPEAVETIEFVRDANGKLVPKGQ